MMPGFLDVNKHKKKYNTHKKKTNYKTQFSEQ